MSAKIIESMVIYLHNPEIETGPSGHPASCGWTTKPEDFKRSTEYPCSSGKMPWLVLFNSHWYRVKYTNSKLTGLPLYYIGKQRQQVARVQFTMEG